jgi:hypothetical protein
VGSSSRTLALLAVGALLIAAGSASAQQKIAVAVTVARISESPCEIEQRARKLDRKLREQFRYECLQVVEARRLHLALDQLGSMGLPNGKSLRVRPLHVGERGALLAVEVEDIVQTDLRVRNRHLVAIGAGRSGDGKLVISLEPEF